MITFFSCIIISNKKIIKKTTPLTYHSHKRSTALLWRRRRTSASGSEDGDEGDSSARAAGYERFFVRRYVWLDLTEFTMSLRAWNPDSTGKTCSVPSAMSASWQRNQKQFSGSPEQLSRQRTFISLLLWEVLCAFGFSASAAFREEKSVSGRWKLWTAGWSFHLRPRW